MDNPFTVLIEKQAPKGDQPQENEPKQRLLEHERRQKRDSLYEIYNPLVNQVLDELIAAYQPGVWKRGSDSTRIYCCLIKWYAGPEEKYKDHYDEHHDIRRHVEIALELDIACNPVSFLITNHEKFHKNARVGLSREELIQGIKQVFE